MRKRPLIGVPTLPFQRRWENAALEEIDGEELKYFWLLSRLTSKIISSVRAAGGAPLALTPAEDEREIERLAAKLDGFVFAGGQDIAPSFYGEESRGSRAPDIERDHFETALCRAALERDKPLLGICRGCQLLNVVLGGTLTQDLPSVDEKWTLHSRSDVMRGYVHEVKILQLDAPPGDRPPLKAPAGRRRRGRRNNRSRQRARIQMGRRRAVAPRMPR